MTVFGLNQALETYMMQEASVFNFSLFAGTGRLIWETLGGALVNRLGVP